MKVLCRVDSHFVERKTVKVASVSCSGAWTGSGSGDMAASCNGETVGGARGGAVEVSCRRETVGTVC